MFSVCRYCGHWKGSYQDGSGDCTLFPEWRKVGEEHFCGQFTSARLPAEEDRVTTNYRNYNIMVGALQKRAIKAEKALKQARSALRQQKKEG